MIVIISIIAVVLTAVLFLIVINYKYINSTQYKKQFQQIQKFKGGVPKNLKYAYFGSTHSFYDFKITENE